MVLFDICRWTVYRRHVESSTTGCLRIKIKRNWHGHISVGCWWSVQRAEDRMTGRASCRPVNIGCGRPIVHGNQRQCLMPHLSLRPLVWQCDELVQPVPWSDRCPSRPALLIAYGSYLADFYVSQFLVDRDAIVKCPAIDVISSIQGQHSSQTRIQHVHQSIPLFEIPQHCLPTFNTACADNLY